jgi:hypothetical protein
MTNTICFLCGEIHPWNECPKMEARPPAPPFPVELPKPPEVAASLPPTQFEQLYGQGAESLLQDVVDGDPELWDQEQRELSLKILAGLTTLKTRDLEERRILDEIGHRMAFAPATKKEQPKVVIDTRPPYVRSQEEMETFENEYMPPPSERDWPFSPDHPEGTQDP